VGAVIHELREFCEDNNQEPPAPPRSVKAREELNYWRPSDPALDIEAMPAVELRAPSGRVCFLQRVVYELRYLLLLENGDEFERGHCPTTPQSVDLMTGFEVARAWLAGGDMNDLPKGRRPIF